MSVANQKIIQIAPREKCDNEHLYAIMNQESMREAMKVLSGSSIKLWLYFIKNQDGYQFELSRVDCEKWGIKKDAYYHAVKELTDKGFLVPLYVGSNIYRFHDKAFSELPKMFSETPSQESKKPKERSEKTERNNIEIKENIKNNTLDDDNADGVIVDCGVATIPSNEEWNEDKRKDWFGTFTNAKVYESETVLLDKYF